MEAKMEPQGTQNHKKTRKATTQKSTMQCTAIPLQNCSNWHGGGLCAQRTGYTHCASGTFGVPNMCASLLGIRVFWEL